MDELSKDAAMQAVHRAGVQGIIAIAYTVWAKKKGGGKHMVNEVYKMIKRFQSFEQISNTESADRHGKEVPLEERSKGSTS